MCEALGYINVAYFFAKCATICIIAVGIIGHVRSRILCFNMSLPEL